MFKAVKPRRVTEEIVAQLTELIGQGDLQPGDRLPPEREMALELGVSRNALREALKRLESGGWVSSQQGSGTYVQDIAAQSLKDPLCTLIRQSRANLAELAEFRTVIESWAAGKAAQAIAPADLAGLGDVIARMGAKVEREEPVHLEDAEFHLILARAAHNRVYFHVAKTIFYLFAQITKVSHERIFATRRDQLGLFAEHRAIYQAIADGDAKLAQRLMRKHLHNTERWFKENLLTVSGEKFDGLN